ncbi:cytochrome c oxidase subunit III (mitochondrion) [Thrips palmi]|uniref:Cytochrome c oxidase subunit 3 n=2 Tax=Thrips palmi TaxID=161013 RepID=A0A386T9T3_THRPL|nr:cytochrome c oxidase subunit III [Thrips palmi]AYE84565.1 cytochrome c oxidase subunit III [Thrips palmi]UKT59923.1 cytochrome c oxidase subunit III [Thrips palmi]
MPKIPFHLVSRSPWPILASFQVFNMVYSTAKLFNSSSSSYIFLTNFCLMTLISWNWWRDIVRESTYEGSHTKEVITGLKLGMMLFITSEVFFFLSFFWAFFHCSLSPDIFIGQMWPCKGIKSFNPMGIPLMNTLILLSSGVTLTAAHHFLMTGKKMKCNNLLICTVMLGVYFTILQYIEYKEASFTIADSIYGSTFFMATGFHGIHVLIGTIFLFICLVRSKTNHFSSYHHFGFEAAAWYWHFVDVVWLFLYIFIYWLGK